nr:hemagglutinin repeat-containing protein [Phascolarctobacterium succinatutens]
MFAGGGLGFTIGKEKQKDQYANQNTEQVGSTVGSVKGNVNLDADKAANVKGSTVVAGKDINITGENVKIENSNSVYNAQEKHEFKRTGLSVSVGGGYVDVVNNAANSVKHATDVEDKRLGALVAVKGYKDDDKAIKDIKGKGGGKVTENLSINVSLGTMKSKSESNSTTTVANASEVKAGGEVNVTSTKKDIDITGSNVEGKDVTLNAKENLNITASKNINKTEQSSKSSSASVGASLELGKGPSYSISGSMSKGEVSVNGTTYNESNVTANKDLSFASGNDTNIKGGKLSGEKVTGSVGGDLNIESKQDSNNYKESNKSVGASVGLGSNKAVSGSASVGKIDSNYKSVTDQSGIYTGKEGFDINVGENTDLRGGIISSEAEKDKNKISTGTLTFEDIRNKADYKAGGAGIKVNKNNDAEYNEKGITPDIGMPAGGEAESKTKATISEGTIEIRDKDKQKQDIEKLNRDTKNSLNKLGEIFDKTKIEERQELANLFGELAYNEIHYMDGSNKQKALYHAVVGGIMSKLTGGDFLAGATAAGINKLVIEEVKKAANYDPDKMQWVSAVLGAVVAEFVSGNAQAGASAAASGTKNNYLNINEYQNYLDALDAIDKDENLSPDDKEILKKQVKLKYKKICEDKTEKGDIGEKDGEGYEWGVDLDVNGDFKGFTVSENINSINSIKQQKIAINFIQSIDKSSWHDNEIRSYTIGYSSKLPNKLVSVGVNIGYAIDKENNVYKVIFVGGSLGADLSNVQISDIIKSLNALDYNISS